jgi:hypothetical protein
MLNLGLDIVEHMENAELTIINSAGGWPEFALMKPFEWVYCLLPGIGPIKMV